MLNLSENCKKVLERRYLSRDESGKITETIEQMFERVARHIASADAIFDPGANTLSLQAEFYDVMTSLKFMPNSPTLMNAGKPLGQLSACFVLPVGDSMEEIFDAVKYAALIHKSGGGTGFSFSRLRGSGSTVRSTGGVASGPISFMKVFNAATEAVKQGGTRRGANMGILRVDHPDIMQFIDCKANNDDITNFNISIAITQEFMEALAVNGEYELIDPQKKTITAKLNAQQVFNKIAYSAWKNGEPGIVFIDRINEANSVPHLGEFECTNPCGEQPLLPYESCNLGSVNLALMLNKDKTQIDFNELGRIVDLAVHFLDNVIEVNRYPLEVIENTTKQTRKIGLGVMGWADMLFYLGIPYNSSKAVELAEEVMGFIQSRSHEASAKLAVQRGSFPAWSGSTFERLGIPMRNATTTTIAPTGTISIICGVSSGVEPLFAISFLRNVMDNDELPEVHPYFSEVAKREGFYSGELMRRIAGEGTVANIDEVPDHIKGLFVTAHDISPENHVKMQAAFQAFTDNAVSKTVNLPAGADEQAVRDVYMLAYESGCKGVTIYRDGSRAEQVLNIGSVNKKEGPGIHPRTRPDITHGVTEKLVIGCGNLYVTVNYDEQGICEVFATLGRAGGCPSQSEATSRLISIALRSGVDVKSILEQLKGIRCHSTLRQKTQKGIKVLSCPDAIGRVLEKVARQIEQKELPSLPDATTGGAVTSDAGTSYSAAKVNCPECDTAMTHEGSCVICKACGYSKCG